MSTIATWDKISGALGSTNTAFGGDWGNLISDFLNGTNIALTDPTKQPRPNTLTRFKHEKLGMFDGDESHAVLFSVDDIDTGPTRKIKIRRMNTPFEEDYMLFEGLPAAILNKEINSDLNTFSNIKNTDIKADAAIITTKLADSSNFLLSTLDNDFGSHHIDLSRIGSAPASPAADKTRLYMIPIDSNNDGLYCKIKKNGSYVEVQIL